ncbi:hypothetical protein BO94DRAFT_60771 [Aspergillus sclerotioniger CBS 115572]|uniref:Uncharacterized protein n=1 Tax=Aspergillus sclerotioniger CBS 115572 TaxID=1450535 RepID=A0A317WNF1_9EURO|nr:hypothetical protein BO94DRAFT_60771 [Aspergillus sclerotioniger CBS 115572]PWY87999.1 hypothetical protein BO94DRAFT_60771 [Aspergillus sclerotioniger CBS 115572]
MPSHSPADPPPVSPELKGRIKSHSPRDQDALKSTAGPAASGKLVDARDSSKSWGRMVTSTTALGARRFSPPPACPSPLAVSGDDSGPEL